MVATTATLDQLPAWAHALLSEERVAHLGLLDDSGRPRVLPVTFAVAAGAVWSAVDQKPKRRDGKTLARVRWLRARPQSTITVDRYDDDWARLAWVQLLGATEILDAAGHDEALAALAERYAPYRRSPPPGPLLRFTPARAVCWRADSAA
jgi:PPOX class probable F420-dependent enzyme